jgi:hypothetical protein
MRREALLAMMTTDRSDLKLKYGYFILLEAHARVEWIIVSVDKGRPN